MIQSNTLLWWPGYNQIKKEERITILSESAFNYDKYLDSDYLIRDNYRYSNNGDIIQIFIIDTELQQRIKKGLEKDQIV